MPAMTRDQEFTYDLIKRQTDPIKERIESLEKKIEPLEPIEDCEKTSLFDMFKNNILTAYGFSMNAESHINSHKTLCHTIEQYINERLKK